MNCEKKAEKHRAIGHQIEYVDCIASTNVALKERCSREQLPHGFVLCARQQSQGKGTDGNSWASAKGNIYASVVFDFDQKVNTLFPFYPAVALCKILHRYGIQAHLKWPNDVLVETKKIAGILCEGLNGKYMIMGIGINVNQERFPQALSSIATSMKIETGQSFECTSILNEFLHEYEALYHSEVDIRQEWLRHSRMVNKELMITQDGQAQKVRILGLSKEGFLQIQTDHGTENLMARSGLDISTDY